MKKVLILGGSGMAGHVVYSLLKKESKLQVWATSNNTQSSFDTIKLDVFNTNELDKLLHDYRPDFVINCIGMLIRESKNSPDKTIYVNAYFPHLLKKLVDNIQAKLIHISTDCVFSGKHGSYKEDSIKDATDIYGMSKSLGEIKDDHHLTIRTSIIGPEIKETGEGLFHWFMSQKAGDTINGYKSNFWSGVTTLELAKFIRHMILEDVKLSGLYHLTNNTKISKYDLLQIINRLYHKNLNIVSEQDYVCDKSFLNTRNDVSNLPMVPAYETMIKDQSEYMTAHKDFYKRYY
jgi:dTDP-4-dehydrorhamnose reductase